MVPGHLATAAAGSVLRSAPSPPWYSPMVDSVAQAFLSAGLPGAVALVAMAFGYLVFREWIASRAAWDKARDDLTALLVAAHEKRAEDAKAALATAAAALTSSANAGQSQAAALAEVREALRSLAEVHRR